MRASSLGCGRGRVLSVLGVIGLLFGILMAAPAFARPSAMKLLPEETLLVVRTPNLNDLLQRLRETSGGRMVRDPQIAPFVERLYGSAGDLYTQRFAEVLGVSWEELQNLPQGEVTFAIVARKDNIPAFVLLIDQGETESVVKSIRERIMEKTREQGGEVTHEKIGDTEITVVVGGLAEAVGIFEKENTIVAATDSRVLEAILNHWDTDGEIASVNAASDTNTESTEETSAEDEASTSDAPQFSGRTLAENDRFVTILRHCRREHDPPPNLLIYADPIGLLREFGRNETGLKIAMATFPALGIDGIDGVGVTMTFASGRYESLTHFHLLLANPRAGVLQVITAEPGETTPQPWVFADLETYMTSNWNFRASLGTIRSLADRFQFEGATDKFIREKISEHLGIDFEKEVIDNLAGRATLIGAYERPARFRGQQNTVAFAVVDEEAAKKSLAAVVAKYADRFEERHFGEITYHRLKIDWPEELRDDPPTDPCFAVVDGYFFMGGSCQLFERAIEARDGTIDRLVDMPQYQQLAAEALQETPGVAPVLFTFSRYEETLRHWYDLLTSEKTKAYFEEHSEGNPFFAALVESMQANELPPYDVLVRYSVPAVGVMYDTETGYHGISFSPQIEVEATPTP